MVVYGNLIRQAYKDVPVILGGIEASLRRLAHYDYWSDRLKRSVLLDSGADLISYGMGELSIPEIAEALDAGIKVEDITYVPGTVYRTRSLDQVYDVQVLPSYEESEGRESKLCKKLLYPVSEYRSFSAGNGWRSPTGSISMWCRTRLPSR